MKKDKKTVFCLVLLGLITAISLVLVSYIHIPIFPQVSHLQYDPADVGILFVTYLLGPVAGLCVTAIVSLLQSLLISGDFPQGAIMHFFATGIYCVVAGWISCRKSKPTLKRYAFAAFAGCFAAIIMMIPLNLIVVPWFYNIPVTGALAVLPWTILFNAVKFGANTVLSLLLFSALRKNKELQKMLQF